MKLADNHDCGGLRARTYSDDTHYYDFWEANSSGTIRYMVYRHDKAEITQCSRCKKEMIAAGDDALDDIEDIETTWELLEAHPESVIMRVML